MWISSLFLAGSLLTAPSAAVPVSMPQACFVFGEVFWSAAQTTAMLSSNCPIQIERQEGVIVLKGPHRTVNIVIPKDPGMHEFVYRWGQSVARFDDEKVEVKPGSVEMKPRNDFSSYWIPVEPKPPAPLAVEGKRSSSSISGVTIARIISWAMRSPSSTIKSWPEKFFSSTFTSPR